MKIVIAQTVALNGGDAAILLGLTRTLTEAFGDVEITVFDSQPAIAQRLYPDLKFRRLLYHQRRTRVGRAAIVPRDRLQVAADGAFALDRPAFESRSGVTVSLRHWPYGASAAALADRFRAVELGR